MNEIMITEKEYKEAQKIVKQYKRQLRQTAVMRGFYAVFSIVWVFMSPITFGIVIPFIYHYVIMGKGNNDPAGDSALIFFAYMVLWFWIHESYVKHKEWFF
jgi:hypothetical protein